jgi:glycosyltransferase involved in cell wall biosynthesis
MNISIYTFVKNGLHYDFHVVDMLKQHLDFADEIIVNEGMSTDNTFEAIMSISPKIKIYRNEWDVTNPQSWSRKFKNFARQKCTGDWCILLDCDEFIPEWEFENIRKRLSRADKDIYAMEYINFYGNYKVYHADPDKLRWPLKKYSIHRNRPDIEVWGDGSNVRFLGGKEKSYSEEFGDSFAKVHHFGFVREAARLREKWRIQRNRNMENKWGLKIPSFIFSLFPHKWEDPDFLSDLEIYNGPFCKAVESNPNEFIRDKMKIYDILSQRKQSTSIGQY